MFPDLGSYLTDDDITVSLVVKKEKCYFDFSCAICDRVSQLVMFFFHFWLSCLACAPG